MFKDAACRNVCSLPLGSKFIANLEICCLDLLESSLRQSAVMKAFPICRQQRRGISIFIRDFISQWPMGTESRISKRISEKRVDSSLSNRLSKVQDTRTTSVNSLPFCINSQMSLSVIGAPQNSTAASLISEIFLLLRRSLKSLFDLLAFKKFNPQSVLSLLSFRSFIFQRTLSAFSGVIAAKAFLVRDGNLQVQFERFEP